MLRMAKEKAVGSLGIRSALGETVEHLRPLPHYKSPHLQFLW